MFTTRPIQAKDNEGIAKVIREVSKEFGLAAEAGFAVSDPILDNLYDVYNQQNSKYWVIVDEHDIVCGGGGISPLKGDASIMEVQKFYFLPKVRGLGYARELLNLSFEHAKRNGFNSCYLETTRSLAQAVTLYKKFGFKNIDTPRGNTGHSLACEIYMLKNLHDEE